MAATLPLVSVEEYLNTDYHPDKEYVDGRLVKRNVGTLPHSRLQLIVLMHFMQYTHLGLQPLPECRTRTRTSRFRVPDVMVVETPFDKKALFYDRVPFAIIEVLSPEDRLNRTVERFAEYAALGVPFIVQMDPTKRVTHVYRDGGLVKQEVDQLEFRGNQLPFDTRALYAQLD